MNIGGLVSGMDTQSLITKLIQVESQPKVVMQQRQHTYELRKGLWNEINSSLLALKTKVDDLLNRDNYVAKAVTSSDESVFTATGDENAIGNKYSITVNTLARAQQLAGSKQGSASTALGLNGSFTISDGTYSSVINVTAGDSLTKIMQSINSAKDTTDPTKDLQVTASIVDNTLVLTHDKTGAANTITLTDGVNTPGSTNPGEILESLGLLKDDKSVARQLQAAKDASFVINGITVTRDKNVVSDVVGGITLTLKKESASADLTVANDVDKTFNAIKAFVDQYNSAVDLMNTRLSESPVKDATSDAGMSKGLLRGDSTLVSTRSQLRGNIGENVPLLSIYNRLWDVGITTTGADFGKSGKLEIDETKLRNAIEQNPDAVADLFMNDSDLNGNGTVEGSEKGIAVRLSSQLEQLTSSSTTSYGGVVVKKGTIPGWMESLDKVISSYDDKISAFDDHLKKTEKNLWAQFNAMEKALSTMQNQASWLAGQLGALNQQ